MIAFQDHMATLSTAETSTVTIPYASPLTAQHGSIRIVLQGDRKVNVNIQKKTQEGIDLYYDTVLDPAQSETDQTEYVFFLDCCEYNMDAAGYVSSYQLTISDCTTEVAVYQEQSIVIIDPNFSTDIRSTIYQYNVTMQERETGGVIATIPVQTVSGSTQTYTNNVTLYYLSTLMGDVDGNGEVSVEDAVLVLTYYARRSASLAAEIDEEIADVNQDGAISIEDAVGILTYYARASAGLTPSFA